VFARWQNFQPNLIFGSKVRPGNEGGAIVRCSTCVGFVHTFKYLPRLKGQVRCKHSILLGRSISDEKVL